MADDAETTGKQMQGHVATYSGMIGLLKWGAIGSFVVAFAVIWLIS
jgi:hypothetical protein